MYSWFWAFAKTQSRDEVQRQYGAAIRLEPSRFVLALVPFGVAAIFISPWLCLVLAFLNSGIEVVAIRLLGRVDPPNQLGRYFGMLALFATSQSIFMLVPAIVWQDPDGFAKSFAVGMYFVNLIHLATVRTVHLPLTAVSLTTATLVAVAGNGHFWIASNNWTGLFISTFCLAATTYFVVITMSTVHQLYQEMFRDRMAAEAANDAKSRFLAQMSHELRTPLNAILGMGYAELTAARTPESKERLSTMVQSARNLSVLLNDILDMSAVQAGQLPIRPTVVNLRAETEATIALFRQQISDSDMRLTLTFADDVPEYAEIDGQRYRQCLSNVLSNAIKYSQQGDVAVKVAVPVPHRIEVVVSDTGPGVPERLRERIFEPFLRGESLVSGTGLGLSISRTLTRRMGGDLVLLPGDTGAHFQLSFALKSAERSDAIQTINKPLPDLRGKRVLVVDDIATNRLVAMTYLRIMGADPFEAENGLTALTLIECDPPDCVLLDMLMPDMDGLATLQRIRALPGAGALVPVIAMTADATDERRRQYISSGLDGYITKPLAPEDLGAAIIAVL
jgi:signal transduction histidine kinase/CheY-like chemotaxis protein